MADTQPEKSEEQIAADIGEASGMGTPDLSEEETPAATEEEAEEPAAEVTPSKKPASADAEEESEEDDAEEEDEGEEEDEAEEDDDDKAPKSRVKTTTKKRPERLVPYSLVKTLRTEVDGLKAALGKLTTDKEGKTEEEIDEIDAEAAELQKELELVDGTYGSKDLAKILRKAVDIARKKSGDNIPADLKERLKILDEVEAKHESEAETAYFEKEWGTVLPDLKKLYPNAGDSELGEAKKLLDKLAHTKDYHKYELDYILFKKRKDFETILKVAAKSKSGETGKRIGGEESFESKEDEDNLENIEDLTPEIVKAREDKEASTREASPKDYKVTNPIR